jgi:hypothetical protein
MSDAYCDEYDRERMAKKRHPPLGELDDRASLAADLAEAAMILDEYEGNWELVQKLREHAKRIGGNTK